MLRAWRVAQLLHVVRVARGMGKTAGFKTRPSTYSIGHAPTSRARCRLCKQGVNKGEIRIVTHAFVRPGRSHDFVCHASCATPALVRAMVSIHGSVQRVPVASGIETEAYEGVCVRLERVI